MRRISVGRLAALRDETRDEEGRPIHERDSVYIRGGRHQASEVKEKKNVEQIKEKKKF